MLQNPVNMGYLGVKTMVAHLRGEKVEKRIDTGAVLVTPENMDQPGDQGTAAAGPFAMAEVASATGGPPRLAMRGIRKAFGATVALDGVDSRGRLPARCTRWWARTAPARAR